MEFCVEIDPTIDIFLMKIKYNVIYFKGYLLNYLLVNNFFCWVIICLFQRNK